MASNVVSRNAGTDLDDDIAALKQELALARRQRLRRQDAPASSDGRIEAGGYQAPSVPPQPAPAQGIQASSDIVDLQHQIRELTKKLRNVDPDVKGQVLDALIDAGRQSFWKNLIASIVLSTIFLIAGWLLSIVATPATLSTLFHH